MAKFSTSAGRKGQCPRLAFGISVVAIVAATGALAGSNNPVQPVKPAPAAAAKAPVQPDTGTTKRVARVSRADHLETMDELRAEFEIEKLRRDIAKVKAEKREAENPSLPGLSPLPGGPMSLMPPTSLDMPPLPPSRSSSNEVEARLLEAWGSGMDRQARISTKGGDRIVRVGDAVAGGRVVGINGSAVIIDVRGKRKVIE